MSISALLLPLLPGRCGEKAAAGVGRGRMMIKRTGQVLGTSKKLFAHALLALRIAMAEAPAAASTKPPSARNSGPDLTSPGATKNGRYVLRSELNRGGTAVVYEALDTQTSQRVAIKVTGLKHARPSLPEEEELQSNSKSSAGDEHTRDGCPRGMSDDDAGASLPAREEDTPRVQQQLPSKV